MRLVKSKLNWLIHCHVRSRPLHQGRGEPHDHDVPPLQYAVVLEDVPNHSAVNLLLVSPALGETSFPMMLRNTPANTPATLSGKVVCGDWHYCGLTSASVPARFGRVRPGLESQSW